MVGLGNSLGGHEVRKTDLRILTADPLSCHREADPNAPQAQAVVGLAVGGFVFARARYGRGAQRGAVRVIRARVHEEANLEEAERSRNEVETDSGAAARLRWLRPL